MSSVVSPVLVLVGHPVYLPEYGYRRSGRRFQSLFLRSPLSRTGQTVTVPIWTKSDFERDRTESRVTDGIQTGGHPGLEPFHRLRPHPSPWKSRKMCSLLVPPRSLVRDGTPLMLAPPLYNLNSFLVYYLLNSSSSKVPVWDVKSEGSEGVTYTDDSRERPGNPQTPLDRSGRRSNSRETLMSKGEFLSTLKT